VVFAKLRNETHLQDTTPYLSPNFRVRGIEGLARLVTSDKRAAAECTHGLRHVHRGLVDICRLTAVPDIHYAVLLSRLADIDLAKRSMISAQDRPTGFDEIIHKLKPKSNSSKWPKVCK